MLCFPALATLKSNHGLLSDLPFPPPALARPKRRPNPPPQHQQQQRRRRWRRQRPLLQHQDLHRPRGQADRVHGMRLRVQGGRGAAVPGRVRGGARQHHRDGEWGPGWRCMCCMRALHGAAASLQAAPPTHRSPPCPQHQAAANFKHELSALRASFRFNEYDPILKSSTNAVSKVRGGALPNAAAFAVACRMLQLHAAAASCMLSWAAADTATPHTPNHPTPTPTPNPTPTPRP